MALPSPTWRHVPGLQADGAVLPIGARTPGRGGEGRLPAHCSGRVDVVLEIVLLHMGGRPGLGAMLGEGARPGQPPRGGGRQHSRARSSGLRLSRPSPPCSPGSPMPPTLTRGTLKATGSMEFCLRRRALAKSTSRTSHSVLGRNTKPWESREGDVRVPQGLAAPPLGGLAPVNLTSRALGIPPSPAFLLSEGQGWQRADGPPGGRVQAVLPAPWRCLLRAQDLCRLHGPLQSYKAKREREGLNHQ